MDYACELVAQSLGVYVEPPPTFWMEWGMENEVHARRCYEDLNGCIVDEVGFIMPDDTDAFGGSPDGLVGEDGLLETKCPKAETLIKFHAEGDVPMQYYPQIQGLLLISGREWCDLFCWHPQLNPYVVRVYNDEPYQFAMLDAILKFIGVLNEIKSKVFATANMTWDMDAAEGVQ